MKKALTLVFFLVILPASLSAYPIYELEVERVIDGDTVAAVIDMGFGMKKSDNIRLWGINTPELRSEDQEEKKKAQEAKEYVEKAIQQAKTVRLDYVGQDKYGRAMGIILVDGQDLNEDLLQQGLAVEYMRNGR